jgi:hypothetical protein
MNRGDDKTFAPNATGDVTEEWMQSYNCSISVLLSVLLMKWKALSCLRHVILHCKRPSSFLCTYAGLSRPRNSSQVRVPAITETNGNWTLEASPLLQSTTQLPLSTNCYLFWSEYYNFLFIVPKWSADNFRETWGVQPNHVWLRLIPNAKSPKTSILRERRFIPKKDLNWRHPSQIRILLQLADLTSRSHHAISTS